MEKVWSLATTIFASLATLLMIAWKFTSISEKLRLVPKFLPQILFLFFFYLFLKTISKIWKHPVVAGSISNITSMPLQLAKEFENRIAFESKLKRLFKAWLNKKTGQRIVLIDRCSRAQVIQIVDELYALISTQDIENKLVCIVAVDEDALEKAIEENHCANTEDYFEKLFSLKIYVPKLKGARLEGFLEETIGFKAESSYNPNPKEIDFNYDDYRLDDVEKTYLHQMLGGASNREGVSLRKAKRIIISYQFLKYTWPNWFAGTGHFLPSELAVAIMHMLSVN